MKTKRMISALISACFLSFSFCRIPFTLTAKAETETVQYEKLTYEIADGHAVLTAYTEGIESAVIPDSIEGCPVTAVADLAFANCPTLKSIVLPDSLTDLGNRAFLNCTALESVTLPEGLTAIRHNTFNRCTALERIVIPDSVRVLGTGAFRNCTKLADITFPERLDSVDFRVLTDSAWLDNQPDGFVCFSNVLYGYQGTMPENTVVSPDENITVIAAGALMNQGGLTAVTLREPVSSIGEDAFSACGNLKSVSVPGTVKVIGDYAFAQCRSLEEVTLGSGIGQIGMRAFYDCDALNSITIPASVTEIGDMAVGFRQSPTSPEDDILVVKVSEDFTVFGYAGSTAEGYARTNGIRFSALGAGLIRGDADGDGSLRISDAVLLQKWLLGYADVQLQNWRAADLNDDGTLNAVDLSLMKRALMEQPAHQELQIVLNGSSAKRLSDSFRLQMQELIKARVPDFDFVKQYLTELNLMNFHFNQYATAPVLTETSSTKRSRRPREVRSDRAGPGSAER